MSNKIPLYSLVRMADVFPEEMAHLGGQGEEAIVDATYGTLYGNGSVAENDKYQLLFEHGGIGAWYPSNLLTLLKTDQRGLAEQWIKAQKERDAVHGDLDWIFSQTEFSANNLPEISYQALFNDIFPGRTLRGEREESITLIRNILQASSLAAPFLQKHDKEGWLAFSDELKQHVRDGDAVEWLEQRTKDKNNE